MARGRKRKNGLVAGKCGDAAVTQALPAGKCRNAAEYAAVTQALPAGKCRSAAEYEAVTQGLPADKCGNAAMYADEIDNPGDASYRRFGSYVGETEEQEETKDRYAGDYSDKNGNTEDLAYRRAVQHAVGKQGFAEEIAGEETFEEGFAADGGSLAMFPSETERGWEAKRARPLEIYEKMAAHDISGRRKASGKASGEVFRGWGAEWMDVAAGTFGISERLSDVREMAWPEANGWNNAPENRKDKRVESWHRRYLEVNLPAKPENLQDVRSEVREVAMIIGKYFADYRLCELKIQELPLSMDRLRKLFRSETGFTMQQYLRRCQLRQAAMLLTCSSLCVSEIAETVGIPECAYFVRLFKKEFGETPGLFRKNTYWGRRKTEEE